MPETIWTYKDNVHPVVFRSLSGDERFKFHPRVTHTVLMTSSVVPSDLISQPRVIFGRMLGSALIRSKVCIMASTLWIPYCSRTAPHFRSWTSMKDTRQNGLDGVHRTRATAGEKHCNAHDDYLVCRRLVVDREQRSDDDVAWDVR